METGTDHHLQVRPSIADSELAFYRCHAPAGASLHELVRVAGARWAIEECSQAAKNQTVLDEYEVRRYDAWYRHITLAMFAHAWLAAQAAAAQKETHSLWTTRTDHWNQAPTAGRTRRRNDRVDRERNPPPLGRAHPAATVPRSDPGLVTPPKTPSRPSPTPALPAQTPTLPLTGSTDGAADRHSHRLAA